MNRVKTDRVRYAGYEKARTTKVRAFLEIWRWQAGLEILEPAAFKRDCPLGVHLARILYQLLLFPNNHRHLLSECCRYQNRATSFENLKALFCGFAHKMHNRW